jgi:hypothetical protein
VGLHNNVGDLYDFCGLRSNRQRMAREPLDYLENRTRLPAGCPSP